MIRSKQVRRVGGLRPSQLLMTYGVGSVIDLPKLSVMVMGLDNWPLQYCDEISEPRLLAAVRKTVGGQVERLLAPPLITESEGYSPGPFDEASEVGVPVAPFPRWLVCPACRLLAPIASTLFQIKYEPFRPDRTRYIHPSCNRFNNPEVIPARFVVACEDGHFDDFPWIEFVHPNGVCGAPELQLIETGASGEAVDVRVKCQTCGVDRTMANAFGEAAERDPSPCFGRRPHLRDYESDGCNKEAKTMLLGASNSWFAASLNALSLPTAGDRLGELVDEHWSVVGKAENKQNIALLRQIGQMRPFAEFTDDHVWDAIERRRGASEPEGDESDLKTPEWAVLINPKEAPTSEYFRLSETDVPAGYEAFLDRVVLARKLREVRALVGFTRIDSPGESADSDTGNGPKRVPLSRRPPSWVPASEVRGEGVFIKFHEDAVNSWAQRCAPLESEFLQAHRAWRARRRLDPNTGFPGIRYVLLHSFAHVLIRQLAVECGYAAASIRERIYSKGPDEAGGAMAGVLLYTAAPDSEGTLGGLVSSGEPLVLGRHLDRAFEKARLCPSDPLCAERSPSAADLSLHGSACHACLFASETSCERGNRYLDRSVLVGTLERTEWAFFGT